MTIAASVLVASVAAVMAAANKPTLQAGDTPPPSTAKITADTLWSGERTIDDRLVVEAALTIAPGAVIRFGQQGRLSIRAGGSLTARGKPGQTVTFVAKRAGAIDCASASLVLEHCVLEGLGAGGKDGAALSITTSPGKTTALRHCRFDGCSSIRLGGDGSAEIAACDIRRPQGDLWCCLGGKLQVLDNTGENVTIEITRCQDDIVVRGNIVVGGTISCGGAAKDSRDKLLVEANYVHRPIAKGNYALLGAVGTIRDNVLRGGTWVSAQLGGRIIGNVFEAIPAAQYKKLGGLNDHGTHEHICGLRADAVVMRNLFLHPSYGAIMGIGPYTCSKALIRNNTFDLRGGGNPVYLNHLPENRPWGVVVLGNLFLRGGPILDEKGIDNTLQCVDYNLWCQPETAKRFSEAVKIDHRKPGDPGFGSHDLPGPGKSLTADEVVTRPDFEFPYTDDEMLARKHAVKHCLDLYRQAYTPRAGSPAIGAGPPADQDGVAVVGGRPCIGAIEADKKQVQ